MSFAQENANNQEEEGYARLRNIYDANQNLYELKKRLFQYAMFNPCFSLLQRAAVKETKTQHPIWIHKIWTY